MQPVRVGQGIDFHTFIEGRPLVMGGVVIPHSHGLLGHSDADVLTHAVMDALLGAAGLRDIGHYFPDTDEQWRGASSITMMRHVMTLVRERGWRFGNCDITVLAEVPRLAPFVPMMQQTLAAAIGCAVEDLSIKATTVERMGAIGRKEGVAAFATALLFAEVGEGSS